MLKLIIAEDEALERKALKFLLEKHYSDSIKIVYEASNGRDAVDNAIILKPDIVLMDIHMPILGGLDASNMIKKHYRETEIIILTAYNYFDYARKAIGIGVSDYLLKPFSNDEFFTAINIVMDRINSKIINETKNKDLKENYKKVIPYIEKQMVANIVYGVTLTDEQFEEYADILSIKSSKFCCILFNLEDKKIFDEECLIDIKNKLKIIFNKTVGGLCLNNVILFVFDEEVESKILSKGFENILNSLRDDFKLNKQVNLSIGVGHTNSGLNKLYLSYKEAKRSSQSKENPNTTLKNVASEGVSNDNNLKGLTNKLCGKIINEDLIGAIIECDTILELLITNESGYDLLTIKKILLNIFDDVIENIHEFIGTDFKNFDRDKMLMELIDLREISDLKNCSSMILKKIINYIYNYKKSKNIDVVEKIKKYIEVNYMKDLSLDEMSQYVCMSSFYLSRIFTKIEKTNLKEYLIKIRMEKAKTMLREGNKSIKQISMEVGYVDQNYFGKAFKKYVNLSPKEYSNL